MLCTYQANTTLAIGCHFIRQTIFSLCALHLKHKNSIYFRSSGSVFSRRTNMVTLMLQCCVRRRRLSSVTYVLWLNGASYSKSYY